MSSEEARKSVAPQAAERVFSPEVEAELPKHAGQYVAMTYDLLLAWGDDPAAVLAEARSKTSDLPILFRVPSDDDRAYFF